MKKKRLKISRDTIKKLREVEMNKAYPTGGGCSPDIPGTTDHPGCPTVPCADGGGWA